MTAQFQRWCCHFYDVVWMSARFRSGCANVRKGRLSKRSAVPSAAPLRPLLDPKIGLKNAPFPPMYPQMCPQNAPKDGWWQRSLRHCKSDVFKGEMKRPHSLWNCAALSVVPGAGIEPARLAAGDFESPASTNFTTRAEIFKPEIMAQWRP
jgi:hypothetical protein